MQDEASAESWLSFATVEIDTVGRRLFVGAIEKPLEPKAFDLLLLFARFPGRAFARDEILDVVWGHHHFTPGALNRAITLLRQALGESAERPQYIHTLHGIGYRFDAPVRAIPGHPDRNEAAPAQQTMPDDKPNFGGISDIATPTVVADARLTSAVGARPPARRVAAFAALGLLAIMLLCALWIWRGSPPPTAASPAAKAPTLIVLPPRAIAGDTGDNAFAAGLGEELISFVAHIEGLHVIAPASSALAQVRGENLAQVAQQLGVTHALEGSVRREGEQLRISLRLTEIASGKTLWAEQYDRPMKGLLALEREVAEAVSAALALKLDPQARIAPKQAEDPVLYRRYLEIGRLRLDPRVRGQAIDAARKLVADAPNYASAHALLSHLLLRGGRPATPESLAESQREAEQALQLDPAQPVANAALGFIACHYKDWERGLKLVSRALQGAPADTELRIDYVLCLGTLGYWTQALEQMRIAHATDPLPIVPNVVLTMVLDTVGLHDEVATKFNLHSVRESDLWLNAIWRRDFAAARRLLAPRSWPVTFSLGRSPPDSFFDTLFAVTDAMEDPAKWSVVRAMPEAAELSGGMSRVFDPQNAPADSIDILDKEWQTAASTSWVLLWNRELPQLRQGPAFTDYLRRMHILDYWRVHGFPPQCKPDGDGARCD